MISFTKFIKEEDDELPYDYEAEEKHIKKALAQQQEARRKGNHWYCHQTQSGYGFACSV